MCNNIVTDTHTMNDEDDVSTITFRSRLKHFHHEKLNETPLH